MDSYPFPMYSGIFEPKHYKRIGSALWFFSWCINATTSETAEEGVTWGHVYGRKPMKLSELAEPFGVEDKTVSRWMKTLEQHDYIRVIRAPYGLIISVKNSKKHFLERTDKNVRSDTGERTKMSDLSPPDQTDMSDLPDKNVRSNKDFIKDFTATTADDEFEKVVQAYCQIHGKADIHLKPLDITDMQRMVSQGIPADLIASVMEQIHKERRAKGARIHSFSYYAEPIQEAWQREKILAETAETEPQTTPVPSGTVAKGRVATSSRQRPITANKRAIKNAEALRQIREAEERDRGRSPEIIHDHAKFL